MKKHKNPFEKGSPCYLAYEAGYWDAIDDATKLMQEGEATYGGDHKAERFAGVPAGVGSEAVQGE